MNHDIITQDKLERGCQRLSRERLAQWRQLGYGMFLSFGMSTFIDDVLDGNAQRISPFRAVPLDTYRPDALDPEQWVRTAAEAGMRYAVLTAKHHTGFCLWPSRHTSYHVGNTAFKTDVIGAFVSACRSYGLMPGLYYASWDEHPDHRFGGTVASEVGWGNDYTTHAYRQFQLNQIEELLTGYGDIGEFWIDIPKNLGPDGRVEQYEQIARLQPDCVISFNQGFSCGDVLDTRQSWPSDLCTMERRLPSNPFSARQCYEERWILDLPGRPPAQPWYIPGEVCDTIGREWFYKEGDVPRSDAELLGMYLVCRERGVNLLLNVAPDRSGLIPPMYAEALFRLRDNLLRLADAEVGK